jgi:SagB-type dehydrogenase family enzyme
VPSLAGDISPTRVFRLLSLTEDVLVEAEPETDHVVVVSRWGEVRIGGADAAVREALRRMSLGPVSLSNVAPGHTAPWPALVRVLRQLTGSVVHSLGCLDTGRALVSLVPVDRRAEFQPGPPPGDRPLRLSRFAALRTVNGVLRIESPLAAYRVELHRPEPAALAAVLAGPSTVADAAAVTGSPERVVTEMVEHLVGAGVLLAGEWARDGEPVFAEDDDPVLRRWSHHDLAFHAHSRLGRSGGGAGAVFPHARRYPPPPLVKTVPGGHPIRLHRPGPGEACPVPGRVITARGLGELLYRAAAIRRVGTAAAGPGTRYATSDRPYLASDGLHELELYVVANDCPGLRRGVYHYDPREHALAFTHNSAAKVGELIDAVRVASRTNSGPRLLIVVTTRLERFSWMYRGIGYSSALTHLGALLQTLSQVARQMGLESAIPSVDPGDPADGALRLDWPAEAGLGEFILP